MKRRRAFGLLALVIGVLIATCGVWLRAQQRQYALNRQLIAALEHNYTRQALTLVNAGADPNTRRIPPPSSIFKFLFARLLHREDSLPNDSPTAFMMACGMNLYPVDAPPMSNVPTAENPPLLQAMLAHGANVNARTYDSLQALHFACESGRLRTVELLLQHGADVDASDVSHRTPLMLSVSDGTGNVVPLLLAHGANPNAQDGGGFMTLFWAVRSSYAKSLIPELIAHGADPNLRDKEGHSPLWYAQIGDRPDLVRLLKRH